MLLYLTEEVLEYIYPRECGNYRLNAQNAGRAYKL